MIYDMKYLVNIYDIYNAIYIGDMKHIYIYIYIYIYI